MLALLRPASVVSLHASLLVVVVVVVFGGSGGGGGGGGGIGVAARHSTSGDP